MFQKFPWGHVTFELTGIFQNLLHGHEICELLECSRTIWAVWVWLWDVWQNIQEKKWSEQPSKIMQPSWTCRQRDRHLTYSDCWPYGPACIELLKVAENITLPIKTVRLTKSVQILQAGKNWEFMPGLTDGKSGRQRACSQTWEKTKKPMNKNWALKNSQKMCKYNLR